MTHQAVLDVTVSILTVNTTLLPQPHDLFLFLGHSKCLLTLRFLFLLLVN